MAIARLIGGLWAGFLVLWWTWALFNKKADRGSGWRGRSWGFRLGMIVVVVLVMRLVRRSGIAAWLAAHGPALLHPAPPWQGIGAALCVTGFAFAIWARAYLGGNWGIPMSMRQEHELVTSGPYARVRHPIYSGLVLAGLGTVLALGVMWLPAVVLVGLFFVISAHTEERMLATHFPEAYPPYKARTRMLIPFVY
jgi:protein-S-isoprenylcysteine O-methyltransferase Ste14